MLALRMALRWALDHLTGILPPSPENMDIECYL
jgi:hypothetical protein